MYENTIGAANVAVGGSAGNTNTSGDFNVFIGFDSDANNVNYDQSMALGYNAAITASSQVRVGNATTLSIGGYQNWSNISDARFKINVREDVPGLDFIQRLRPVTYQLDIDEINRFIAVSHSETPVINGIEAYEMRRTGFLAQEVEAAANEIGFAFDGIDQPDNDKDTYGLRYAEFTVPLVKAVQQLALENQSLKENLVVLQTALVELQLQVTELAAKQHD